MSCSHESIECLNEYEIIRKYRCRSCDGVMMCSCEEAFGVRYLPHQLAETTCSTSRLRVQVTLGFQESLCPECRGLPLESHPTAEIYSRTSKIKRYYWRELLKRELELYGEWAAAHDADPLVAVGEQSKKARQQAAKQALEEVKRQHATAPKYAFDKELSQEEVIRDCSVEVVEIYGTYKGDTASRRVRVLSGQEAVSAEEYVARHYRSLGYECLTLESVPFHVLFGIYLWIVIQDPCDDRIQIRGFGDRNAFDSNNPSKTIFCHLPEDFGSAAYACRRNAAIDNHFASLLAPGDREWLFDYWLTPSERLRQYLWAHRASDIATARQLSMVLSSGILLRVLRYLIDSYWERYLGWPDLLLFKDGELFFAEVKSSKDKLSNDQKRWIRDNHNILKLPFKLVKLRKR